MKTEKRQCLSLSGDGDQCMLDAGHKCDHKRFNKAGVTIGTWARLVDRVSNRLW